jgi:hypothetical protein
MQQMSCVVDELLGSQEVFSSMELGENMNPLWMKEELLMDVLVNLRVAFELVLFRWFNAGIIKGLSAELYM